MKLVTDAPTSVSEGDVAGAKRNADAVLQRDPTFWPALYVRAQIYSHEGKYDLALKDCNEALRQDRSVVRGCAVARGRHQCSAWEITLKALKEYNVFGFASSQECNARQNIERSCVVLSLRARMDLFVMASGR